MKATAMNDDWKLRARLLLQRLWQPTSACMTCMPGSLGNLGSVVHWEIALRTGLFTGLLAVGLSFTPLARLYRNRWGNAALVGLLTVLGDSLSHPGHPGYFGGPHFEAVLTGFTSGSIALAGSFVFEDKARRLRALWRRLAGA